MSALKLQTKKWSIALIGLLITVSSFVNKVKAQQDSRYSMYMFNAMSFNPAYAGSYDDVAASFLFRKQWVGFAGSPQTAAFNIHSPINKQNMGLGLSFMNDKAGAITQNYLNLAYAYHIKFKKSRLALGLQGVVQNFNVGLSKIQTNTTGASDNAFASDISVYGINFGAGAFYYSNKYYFGISAPHLLGGNMEKKLPNDPTIAKQATHAYLMGGYVFTISPIVKLKPSVLVKYAKNTPIQADITAMAYFYDVFGFGATYRTSDAVNVMAEVILNQNFRLGYAYDYTISNLTKYNSGSHEIILQYHFGYNKNKMASPRLF